jgi:hypothetical protein
MLGPLPAFEIGAMLIAYRNATPIRVNQTTPVTIVDGADNAMIE